MGTPTVLALVAVLLLVVFLFGFFLGWSAARHLERDRTTKK
jgi:hypothetical protein